MSIGDRRFVCLKTSLRSCTTTEQVSGHFGVKYLSPRTTRRICSAYHTIPEPKLGKSWGYRGRTGEFRISNRQSLTSFWHELGERQRRELPGALPMAVYGSVEREGDFVRATMDKPKRRYRSRHGGLRTTEGWRSPAPAFPRFSRGPQPKRNARILNVVRRLLFLRQDDVRRRVALQLRLDVGFARLQP